MEDPQGGLAVTSASPGRDVLARGDDPPRPPRRAMATVALAAVIVALTVFIVLSAVLSGTFSAVHLWSAAGLIVSIWEVLILGFAALPLSIGIGILKYRLYEIDRLISRTLAYAIVTGLLVGVYAGLVLHLKDAVDLDSVRADLTAVVHRALEPAHVSLWLTPRD
jgi:hypothetical protein